ncbi:hypothetical protein SAMN05660841_01581 [Sphingobacterium nematocida]|uniref:Uncharacterized protein n=1 Tax=Sphingobacterium nematocida TaxID=1513896 RepID=A0A1T5CW81_9SPHI|nr:hypothetical protein [Sphingobacterium nematocida]SKB63627.1 hypothetical protein SAMN05660841_01581 [Sphingobacterium nematocida]
MNDKFRFLITTLLLLVLGLFGVLGIMDYFYFGDFPSLVRLCFSIVFIIFTPIGIYWNYETTFIIKDPIRDTKKSKLKHFLILNTGIILAVFLIKEGVDFDNSQEANSRAHGEKQIIEITLLNVPREVRNKGKVQKFELFDVVKPDLTFEINPHLFKKHQFKLNKGQRLKISILRKSYDRKINRDNDNIPKILKKLGNINVINIIEIL